MYLFIRFPANAISNGYKLAKDVLRRHVDLVFGAGPPMEILICLMLNVLLLPILRS